jgi:hypothetical protein
MNTQAQATRIQDQVIDGIKQLQSTNLDLAANFSKAASAVMPKAAELPPGYDAKQYIEQSFAFTAEILELQKAYILRLTETIKPLTTASADKARKSA